MNGDAPFGGGGNEPMTADDGRVLGGDMLCPVLRRLFADVSEGPTLPGLFMLPLLDEGRRSGDGADAGCIGRRDMSLANIDGSSEYSVCKRSIPTLSMCGGGSKIGRDAVCY